MFVVGFFTSWFYFILFQIAFTTLAGTNTFISIFVCFRNMNSLELLKYFESTNFSDCKVVRFLRNKVPFEQIKIKQLNATWTTYLEEATYLNSGIFEISH